MGRPACIGKPIQGVRRMPLSNRDLTLDSSIRNGPELHHGGGAFRAFPRIGLSLDRKVQSVNDELCQLLRYRENELVGSSVLTVVHPEDMEALVLRLEALIRNIDVGLNRPIRLFCKEGHAVQIDATLSVTRGATGHPSGVEVVVGETTTQCICGPTKSFQRRDVVALASA
jgi:PAS domain S-box-containing protein